MSDHDSRVHSSFSVATAKIDSISPSGEEAHKTESNASSIEKSKKMVNPYVPLANQPLLQPPGETNLLSQMIQSLSLEGASHKKLENFLLAQSLRIGEVNSRVLEKWGKNLEEEKEAVQKLLLNPTYQELSKVRRMGETQGAISTLQTNGLKTTLDQLKKFEPSVATTRGGSNVPQDNSKMLAVSLVAAMLAGGALVLVNTGVPALSSLQTTPMVGVTELVGKLQPVLSYLTPDMIPFVNLLVLPMIYRSSWDTAIGSIHNKEAKNTREAIENFAKQVIKMVSDPAFIYMSVISKMPGAGHLTPENKDLLTAKMKLILASVGLSLLYSFDVGKVQGKKFWGMEPQEFKALLTGEIDLRDPKNTKLSLQQQLSFTLINQVRAELSHLSPADKEESINLLFEYLEENHSMEDLLDPVNTFHAVLSQVQFNANANGLATSHA